ncbi:MAG TPA: hypothetical protein VFH33_02435 [Candidatus Krumholzibacteria bacterium]|nr:hypothetical protein [Candidatus Krumholzibacteria bacterium]
MRLSVAAAYAALAIGLFVSCSDDSGNVVGPGKRGGSIFGGTSGATGVQLLEDFSRQQVLPTNNWWNLDISRAPVDANSSSYISWIGNGQQLHPDMAPPPWGIPYIGVSQNQPLSPVTFTGYASESDTGLRGAAAGYPIPDAAKTQENYIENAAAGGNTSGDRHMLLIDRDRWILYELYGTRWTGSRWEASSGAVFDLKSNGRRPEGWTSTDAAGLAVFPGLVRYDEVAATGPITHALRVATRATNGHVWPASHTAGSTSGAPPLGTRLRLKAATDISGYPPDVRKIFQAMKTYGLIIADNGGNMYVTGTMDERWDNGVLNPAFHSLHAGDFEVIQLGWGSTMSR